MIKVFIVMASLVGLLFYFLGGSDTTNNRNDKSAIPTGLQKLASLPASITESSGVEVLSKKGNYITHNDAGNSPQLFYINEKGDIVETHKLNIPNVDWEDLSKDDDDNLYIADTGNNNNRRKELAIYKVSLDDMNEVAAIRYTYEDQKSFPPAKKDMNFDSEAFFWYDSQLYIITKDRGQKRTAKVYRLSDEPGTYKAELVGSTRFNGQVTSAAISPDGKLVVLLEEGRIHLYRNFEEPASFYEGKSEEIELTGAGQTEAVAFEDNHSLIITSEGGSLYRLKLAE